MASEHVRAPFADSVTATQKSHRHAREVPRPNKGMLNSEAWTSRRPQSS
jgi:hypothetical protein